jgi:hypothetical protein
VVLSSGQKNIIGNRVKGQKNITENRVKGQKNKLSENTSAYTLSDSFHPLSQPVWYLDPPPPQVPTNPIFRRWEVSQFDFYEVGNQPIIFFRGLNPVQSVFYEVGSQPIRLFRGLGPAQSDFYEVGIEAIRFLRGEWEFSQLSLSIVGSRRIRFFCAGEPANQVFYGRRAAQSGFFKGDSLLNHIL